MRAVAFSATMALAVVGGHARLVECGHQVGVEDERDTRAQLHLRLGGEIGGHGRVVLSHLLADRLASRDLSSEQDRRGSMRPEEGIIS